MAIEAHKEYLSKNINKTSSVLFDEMETFQHTKCKPLSIAIAINNETGDIIDAKVALMRCKGKLAKFSQKKYPEWDNDTRESVCKNVIETVNLVSGTEITIGSDEKKSYPNIVRSIIPTAKVVTSKRKKTEKFDPLFMLNHVAAKIRSDLSRMRRRTWATTKKWENLQRHLDIYIAWNNGYVLELNFC